MWKNDSATLSRVLKLLTYVLIIKVTVSVILNYRNYLPPDFESEFLQGREVYFRGPYQWAFYTHIAAGPVSLILGTILVSERFRLRFPQWHRCLGRAQGLCVLLLVTPSGLWMACYAAAGPIAAVGFAVLAVVTGICVALGWRAAIRRRFSEHRRWMWRCYLLLCSAVVLRMIGGLAIVTDFSAEWVDPLAAWACWLMPLLAFELTELRRREMGRLLVQPALTSQT